MTLAEATQALLDELLARLAAAGVVVVVLDNETHDPTPDDSWTHVSVEHTDARQVTLGPPGARRWAYRGRVTIRSYAPVDHGTSPSTAVVDALADLAGVNLVDTLVLRAPLVKEGTRRDAWHVSTLELPFEYERIL